MFMFVVDQWQDCVTHHPNAGVLVLFVLCMCEDTFAEITEKYSSTVHRVPLSTAHNSHPMKKYVEEVKKEREDLHCYKVCVVHPLASTVALCQ